MNKMSKQAAQVDSPFKTMKDNLLVEKAIYKPDTIGGYYISEWMHIGRIWGKVTQTSSVTKVIGGQLCNQVQYLIKVRARNASFIKDYLRETRLNWRGRFFTIQNVEILNSRYGTLYAAELL